MPKPPSIDLIEVSDTIWVYGEAKGLAVVIEDRSPDGTHIRTLQTIVPWHTVDTVRRRNK